MKTIMPQDVEMQLKQGKSLNIIDVREDEEVAQGIIPGAKHYRLGDLPITYTELDQSKEYIIVCRSGRRSAQACAFLEEMGFSVANLEGGMLDWTGEVE
ncbi:rhodanese-like domain-containing protein [Ectobacillus polymachus]|uniref:rhodanese-like domain-containing protein n=1 Tax=Ectobacillus polymachus TaxID=1508806 RepID=UPI003A8536D7